MGCSTPGNEMPVMETTAMMNDEENVQEVTVKLESHFFDPNLINVVVGVPVRMTLTNGTTLTPHNFSINEASAGIVVNRDLDGGETIVVEFTPTKAGRYQFFCDVGDHSEEGMVGTIVVMTEQEMQAK
jgi:plastocyanin